MGIKTWASRAAVAVAALVGVEATAETIEKLDSAESAEHARPEEEPFDERTETDMARRLLEEWVHKNPTYSSISNIPDNKDYDRILDGHDTHDAVRHSDHVQEGSLKPATAPIQNMDAGKISR